VVADTITFLALGDSYTIGESVDSSLRWPVQLSGVIAEGGTPIAEPVIVARTGWTTDELTRGIDDAGISGTYDLVSLLIGVNNQYRGRDLGEYRTQLRDLLSRAVAFAGGRHGNVLVLSIPDWGVMPFAEGRDRERIAGEIDAFNDVKRAEVRAAGARYVDITRISRRAAEESGLVADDGLHPSGDMYRLWVEAVLPTVAEMLGVDGPESSH
jgi:lysophospholipase L1-like esterase